MIGNPNTYTDTKTNTNTNTNIRLYQEITSRRRATRKNEQARARKLTGQNAPV